MSTNHRPPTIDERFFGHTTIVNVPVSIAPENLPEASTAPVNATPLAPDLTLSKQKTTTTLSNVGTFISNHWVYILAGTICVGSVYWYYKKQKEESKESKPPTQLN